MVDSTQWLIKNLKNFAKVSFNNKGHELFNSDSVRFISFQDIPFNAKNKNIYIPIDHQENSDDFDSWQVLLGEAELQLIHRTPKPLGWLGVPNDINPAWWRSPFGSMIPAWDLWGVCFRLLTFKEERETADFDRHGRFPIESSWRNANNVTHVPFVNNAVAMILDAVASVETKNHELLSGISKYVAPPLVVLSHDWDNLIGNNFWTQLARIKRAADAILRGNIATAFTNIKFLIKNFIDPYKYYFDDQLDMWRIEKKYGFNSVSYILNGKGGRFGARTRLDIAARLASEVPAKSEIGVHYNYGLSSNPEKLNEQIKEINRHYTKKILSGRAHYLRFNPIKDFEGLISCGIQIDESVGWINKNSYRAGIAGPFVPLTKDSHDPPKIITLPMIFNDGQVYIEDGTYNTFSKMVNHIVQVGGCISLLVHPGGHNNPEWPEMIGVYESSLRTLSSLGFKSVTPSELFELFNSNTGRGV